MKIDTKEILAECVGASISDFARRCEDYCKLQLREYNVQEFREAFEMYQCYTETAEKYLGEYSPITKELKRTSGKLEESFNNLNKITGKQK